MDFIRPKLSDGSWKTSYSPARAGVRDFTEGNGWQYTFFAPQDPYGLIRLFGGEKGFTRKLDQFFTNHDSMGSNAQSDITGLIGQYAHGNEPSHHIAYLSSMQASSGRRQRRSATLRMSSIRTVLTES